MKSETLIIVLMNKKYSIHFENYQKKSSSSELPGLLNQTATFIWRWAITNRAKVYFKQYCPENC